MGYEDPTEMGGTGRAFLTTHWTLIEKIKSGEDKDRALIGLMLERYWKPVYCYLRRKGYDNETAKDLTQGFLHEIVLNRGLVHKADQSRGRFRSLLLTALNLGQAVSKHLYGRVLRRSNLKIHQKHLKTSSYNPQPVMP